MNEHASGLELAVITGGTKGIGLALVRRFLQAGFAVATCSRQAPDIEKLLREEGEPGRLFALAADLSTRVGVDSFAAFVHQLALPVRVLINNTGTYQPGQTHQEPEGALAHMLDTNLHSAYHLTRALLPGMMARRRGHVFNVCSTASIKPFVNGGSYCISKYALRGFTQVLREEMKPYNLAVTAIMPGATLTSSWEGTTLPDSRLMPPEDIAEAVYGVFALSERTVVEELLLRPMLGDIE
jgi:short-subunit dehydrogenase